ncbi:MAG: radical SAM protein [Euryarchaeota archaeon]|nr:radical SAM protein [Euryarchaeota archaeon]
MRTTIDLYSFDSEGEKRACGVRVVEGRCRSALVRSRLPGLDYALNPYGGCEHRCLYCYAPAVLRVPRASWGRSIVARTNIPEVLSLEVKGKRGTVGIGTVTDPYQPAEEKYRLTGRCLEVLSRSELRTSVLTKSDLVLRDAALLEAMRGVEVGITITTCDDGFAAQFEPGAPPPSRRIRALAELNDRGVETYALIGPVLPQITEKEMERLISEIAHIGTKRIMSDRLRLRPGTIESLRSAEAMSDERFRGEFEEKTRSRKYFEKTEEEIRRLCRSHGISFETAF